MHALLVKLRAHGGGCQERGSHHTLQLCHSSTVIGSWGRGRQTKVAGITDSGIYRTPESHSPGSPRHMRFPWVNRFKAWVGATW